MKIHYLQHAPFEGPGAIAHWAQLRRYPLACTRLYNGDALPDRAAFDLLIVMGGPMSVHDEREYPWLIAEKKFIESALRAGKCVLGICLGAQLLAHVLGARVYRAREKEIGWFPVRSRAEARVCPQTAHWPESFEAFHWHGETFDLPAGAAHLAETEVCPNQAFGYADQAVALQFHLEATSAGVREFARHCGSELENGGEYVQTGDQLLGSNPQFAALEPLLFGLLDALTATTDN